MPPVGLLKYCNPNSIRSYKIVQKLSPKHAARGVAQSPYPTYRHGKACLSKQPPWRAAGDPRLARGRSRVLHPPFLPPSGDSFFRTFPTKRVVRLGLKGELHLNQNVSMICALRYLKIINTFLERILKQIAWETIMALNDSRPNELLIKTIRFFIKLLVILR